MEHLIRMRERLDEHSRFLESQLAGLESLVLDKGNAIRVASKIPAKETIKGSTSKPVSPVVNLKPPEEKNDDSKPKIAPHATGTVEKDRESIEPFKLPPKDSKPEPTQAYVPAMPSVPMKETSPTS